MKIAIDSDALIKLTKAGAKEIVVKCFEVIIPYRVYEETVVEGEGYSDSKVIDRNIDEKKISVVAPYYSREKGEIAILDLYRARNCELLVSDDKKFLRQLSAEDVPYLTPTALIINLLARNLLSPSDAEKYIDDLKMYISEEEYLSAIQEVFRWAK